MARVIGRLTALQVARAKPGMHADGGGLYLCVNPHGARSWIFRYMLNRRAREMGLGPVHTVGLAEARQKALDARRQLLDGIDPIAARQAGRQQRLLEQAKTITFKACAEQYIQAHRAGWKNKKHAQQWDRTLATYAYPHFGALAVAAVDVGLVRRAVEPIWAVKPETAGRVRGRIEAVLDYAASCGYRQGDNPARWKGHLENLLPQRAKVRRVAHHAALPYDEIAAFLAALRGQEGVAARALDFAILTAARTGEVMGARWEEIDLANRLWTIPAERMKGGREHRVPLCDAALSLLNDIRGNDMVSQGDSYLFPGGRAKEPGNQPLSNMAFLMLLRRMGRGDLTAHGFRSTFRDWAAERTNFPRDVAEMALAHAIGDKVEAAYRRGDLFDKRRQLMAAWAKFCDAPPATAAGDVVAIRRAG
jgi:integrase